MKWWLATIGLVSVLGQVVLLREINVAFFGNDLIYVLALGVWMFHTALGAALRGGPFKPSPNRVRWLLLIIGGVLPASVVWTRSLRLLLGAVPGAYLPLTEQLGALTVSVLPCCVLLGLVFQWAAQQLIAQGGTLAQAYAVESVGAMAGGLLATGLLAIGWQNLTMGILCGVLSVTGSLLGPRATRHRRTTVAATLLLGGLLSFGLLFHRPLDRVLTGFYHPNLVATDDTPYGRVTITARAHQVTVFENDALSFDSEDASIDVLAHLAAIQRRAPRSILALGGGAEGLIGQLLQHHPQHVDHVQLNRSLIELTVPFLPQSTRAALQAPRVQTTYADPRRFLSHSEQYDLIVVAMPEPMSALSNRYYTQEFFARCASRLTPDGVLAFRLEASENRWTPQLIRRTASIVQALRQAFTDWVLLPGGTVTVLASPSPLSRDGVALGAKLEKRSIVSTIVTPQLVQYLYTNDRYQELATMMRSARAPVNSDARPVCYQYNLVWWLTKLSPRLAAMSDQWDISEPTSRSILWLFMLLVLCSIALVRRGANIRRLLLVFWTGFGGVVLETAMILRYQVARGALFQDLGVLLTSFMAGLAAGAWGVHYLARRANRLPSQSRWIAVVGLGLLLGVGIAVALWPMPNGILALLWASGGLFGAGAAVAGVFAAASSGSPGHQHRSSSTLYAADLAGGCIGSIVATLFLIPILGLAGTAWIIVGVACAAAALV